MTRVVGVSVAQSHSFASALLHTVAKMLLLSEFTAPLVGGGWMS